mgnify:CR=1 FL=1
MYEGNNKVALLSQQLIADALLKLLESNTYTSISISDICKEASVSRQTFYSLFGTKDSVMIYQLSNSCCYTPEHKKQECRKTGFREFCREYSQYIIRNRHTIELLVRNDMIHFLYDMQYQAFMECEHFIHDIYGDDRQFLIDFIAGGMSSIAKNYILTDSSADEEFLADLMFRLFSGSYIDD